MNEMLSEEDVARRYAHSNPGYRLISYHPAATRVYRLSVRVLKMVKSDLPVLDEFVMRCIDAELTSHDSIAELLGLNLSIVDRALYSLQNRGLVYMGATGASVSHRLMLSPKGKEVLFKRKIEHPVEDTIWLEMDGLTGSISMMSPRRPNGTEVGNEGFVIVDPLPRLTPKFEDAKQKQMIREAWIKEEQRYDLIDVLAVIKREPCFRDDGLILAYLANDNKSIRYELVLDGVLSEEHSQAFRTRLAKRPENRFPNTIHTENNTIKFAAESLSQDAVISETQELAKHWETAEHKAEELSTKIRQSSDMETVARLTKELEVIQAERDRLVAQGNSRVIRHLTVFEHPVYLHEALEQCKERLMIISPWIEPKVVNKRFLDELGKAIRRGAQIYIGNGINDDSDERNDNPAVGDLERLARNHKNFQFVRLGDTHAKVLLCDNRFVITGSFNWLSFRGDRNWKPRDEQSTYTSGIPDYIEEVFRINLERLNAAMAI